VPDIPALLLTTAENVSSVHFVNAFVVAVAAERQLVRSTTDILTMTLRTLGRLLRGFILTAAVWAAVWTVAGVALRVMSSFGTTTRWIFLAPIQFWVINGAIAGGVFAALLVASRRRSVSALTVGRTAAWGVAASVVLPVGVALGALARNPEFFSEGGPLPQLLTFATVGALTAAGSLWVARRAVSDSSDDEDDNGPSALLAAPATPLESARATSQVFSETHAQRPNQTLLLTALGFW